MGPVTAGVVVVVGGFLLFGIIQMHIDHRWEALWYWVKKRLGIKSPSRDLLGDFPTKAIPFLTPNETRAALPKFEEFDLNEVAFVGEDLRKLWYCPKHNYKLDTLHMHAKDPGLDSMYFSCRNTRECDGQKCWGSKIIDRAEFWLGIKRVQERWVDPEWLENYTNHIYNENQKAFEREISAMRRYGTMILSDSPKAPVFPDYKD